MTAHTALPAFRCDPWGVVDDTGSFWLARCSCGWQATNAARNLIEAFDGHLDSVGPVPVDPDQIELF